MPDEEILVSYFGGRPQWSGNKLTKIGNLRVEYMGTRLFIRLVVQELFNQATGFIKRMAR